MSESNTSLLDQLKATRQEKFVPGLWKCLNCKFQLSKSIMHLSAGAIGANTNLVAEQCPNGCGALVRVMWREEAEENWENLLKLVRGIRHFRDTQSDKRNCGELFGLLPEGWDDKNQIEAQCTCGQSLEKPKHHESGCPIWEAYRRELDRAAVEAAKEIKLRLAEEMYHHLCNVDKSSETVWNRWLGRRDRLVKEYERVKGV